MLLTLPKLPRKPGNNREAKTSRGTNALEEQEAPRRPTRAEIRKRKKAKQRKANRSLHKELSFIEEFMQGPPPAQ